MLPGLEVLATVPLTASPRPLSQTGCADGFHDYRDTARNARITGLQRPPPAC